jgi:hypothetical protein
MDEEVRLMRALGASAAPSRDPAFTLSVVRAAERLRYREETARAVLRAAGLAAAAACLTLPLFGWVSSHQGGFQTGVLGAAALVVLVGGARLLSARATAVLHQ